MGIIERAKEDIQRITSNSNGFGIAMTLIAPTNETVDVVGLHTKHHLGIDTDGNRVNSKNAHVSISEKLLTDANYPVRNTLTGQVNLKGHLVKAKDSTGALCTYVIREWFPNETVGLITCILGEYE